MLSESELTVLSYLSTAVDESLIQQELEEIQEKPHGFSRGMNP